jgi:hypothetical protein
VKLQRSQSVTRSSDPTNHSELFKLPGAAGMYGVDAFLEWVITENER